MKKKLPFYCLLLFLSFSSCDLAYDADNEKNKAILLGKWDITSVVSPSGNGTDVQTSNEFFDNGEVSIDWIGINFMDTYAIDGSRLDIGTRSYEILKLTSKEMVLLSGETIRHMEKIE